MAANASDGVVGRERFAQLAKAGLPFNPVGGSEIVGKNMDRLLAGMKLFGWADPRFVTQEQAQANGWAVGEQAKNVVVKVRGAAGLPFDDQLLFNATDVLGMPPMAAMLAMSDAEIAVMQGRAVEVQAEDELTVGPARVLEADLGDVEKDADLVKSPDASKVAEAASEVRFGVMAKYWQNGLHNFKGIALAKEINKTIKNKGLEADKDAIARMLAIYPDARRLGIDIVDEEELLADRDLQVNAAEPRTLLNGALVRDKEGAYRPAAGGLAVLVDKGDSLSLKGMKGKGGQGYQAAMELALAKGWTAIELKGKPALLASAWLEAKMLGLDVVNYEPTEKDKAAFAERVAEESKAKANVEQSRPAEQAPEVVEIVPFVNEQGVSKTATVTATVTMPVVPAAEIVEGEVAAPVAAAPVLRTVTRVGDEVRSDVTVGERVEVPGNGAAIDTSAVGSVLRDELANTVNQAQLSGLLVEHGAAPFNHETRNKLSYFAVIENEQGQRVTKWGVDLGRSLSEAGAQAGDVVSLEAGELTPVEVNERRDDGTVVPKIANRVTWATTILSRATEVDQQAEKESLEPKFDVATTGLQVGTILEIVDGFAKQQTGRDPVLDVKWHDLSKMDGPALEVGKMAEIQYAGGRGKVKGPELERAGIGR